MSFFLKKGSKNTKNLTKRKLPPTKAKGKKAKYKKNQEDEEILSEDSEVDDYEGPDIGYESKSEDEATSETPQQKRTRLAQIYIEEIIRQEKERAETDNNIESLINARLKNEDLEEKGKLRKEVADSLNPILETDFKVLRDKNHSLSVTVVVSHGHWIFSGSKDAGIMKWSLKDGKKLFKIKGGKKGMEEKHNGHCSSISALAISSDGKFLASGDNSKLIHIWNPETMGRLKTFKGHRDVISGLAFRYNTHTLYSCSYDRSVKIWSLDEMSYVETLFGHQDKITDIDAGRRERAVTSGGRDGSVRVWKIVEESQLVFNGPECSTDSIKLINDEHFVSCGEDGHLSLWGVMKKKPLVTLRNAHGCDVINGEPYWLSALTALPSSDLVVTGSRDGFIRLWKCSNNFKDLNLLQKISLEGFINSLCFSEDGNYLIAAVGQEHRLGRWWRLPKAKNSVVLIPLTYTHDKEILPK